MRDVELYIAVYQCQTISDLRYGFWKTCLEKRSCTGFVSVRYLVSGLRQPLSLEPRCRQMYSFGARYSCVTRH